LSDCFLSVEISGDYQQHDRASVAMPLSIERLSLFCIKDIHEKTKTPINDVGRPSVG
jgi:hypothetical protein